MAGFEIQFEALDAASPTIQKLSQELLRAAQRSDRFAKDIVNASNKADQGLSKIPPKAAQASSSLNSLQQAGSQLQSQLLQFATVAGITALFKSSADAALEEEEALRRLAFAVEGTGGSFEKVRAQVIAFANSQQQLTRFSDTETFDALGRLVRATGDVDQAMQSARLAFGLASASGKDLNFIIDQLAFLLAGETRSLFTLRREFGAFIGDANTAQGVIDALSARFAGAAETEKGFFVELRKLKNTLGDFQETIGAGVLPVVRLLLEGAVQGAKLFEIFGLAIADMAARAVVHVEFLGARLKAFLTGNFDRLEELSREKADKLSAIEQGFAEKALEIEARFSKERVDLARQESGIKVRESETVRRQREKESEDQKRKALEAHDTLVRLEAERLELAGQALESKLSLIDLEKEQRLRQLEELREKGLLTEDELLQAKLAAFEIAALKSADASAALNADLKAIEEGAKSVASSFASSFSSAVADVILEGKNLDDAMKAVFNSVLRTAIETFTRIAIEAAVVRGATAGALGPIGGLLAVGAFASPIFKGFKLQEGGIVRKPIIAAVGEKGPEAVIPLDRLGRLGGDVNVSVTQTNNITVQGASDEQVRLIMRRIAEATRAGAAEGAELVKSILARQARVSREAV